MNDSGENILAQIELTIRFFSVFRIFSVTSSFLSSGKSQSARIWVIIPFSVTFWESGEKITFEKCVLSIKKNTDGH